MSDIRLPGDAASWLTLARQALEPGPPIPVEQLLILTDLAGRNLRPTAPPPGVTPRAAAVLILLYPDGEELRLPLTVRSSALANHSGEVSLPGGATDPEDESLVATALRECYEELGIDPQGIEVLGTLAPLYIPVSNFSITPIVGFHRDPPTIQFNTQEVSSIITVTLRELLDPSIVVTEQWTRRGMEMLVPFFAVKGHKVWGATGYILSELVARLRRQLAV